MTSDKAALASTKGGPMPLLEHSRPSTSATTGTSRRSSSVGWMFVPALVFMLEFVAFVRIDPNMRAWALPIGIWIALMGFAVARIRERATLLILLSTFAFFLLGKPMMMGYFDYDGLQWNDKMEHHLVLSLSLGLLTIFVGYLLYPRRAAQRRTAVMAARRGSARVRAFRRRLSTVALWSYLITYPFYIYHLLTNIRTASEMGYTGLYVSGQSGFASITAYGSFANSVALCVFLATFPSKFLTWLVLLLSLASQGLMMLTGDRGDFGTFLMMVFAYLFFRARHPTTAVMSVKALVVTLVASVIAIVPLFLSVGIDRMDTTAAADESRIVDFLYGQGSSINVIEYAVVFERFLPEGPYLLNFTGQGFFRLLLGGDGGLAGNTVDYALSGTSLSHSLSYVALGDAYLRGHGVGSSFLAEGYVDLGYWGITLVGLAYGLLVAWTDRFAPGHDMANSLRLLIIPAIAFAPRGSATAFISDLTSPLTMGVLLTIWLVAFLARRPTRQQYTAR
mgnify:CR=1 FL=1